MENFSKFTGKHLLELLLNKVVNWRPVTLLNPWPWLEGSYKIGSVCPSVPPSVCSLVFSESAH